MCLAFSTNWMTLPVALFEYTDVGCHLVICSLYAWPLDHFLYSPEWLPI